MEARICWTVSEDGAENLKAPLCGGHGQTLRIGSISPWLVSVTYAMNQIHSLTPLPSLNTGSLMVGTRNGSSRRIWVVSMSQHRRLEAKCFELNGSRVLRLRGGGGKRQRMEAVD